MRQLVNSAESRFGPALFRLKRRPRGRWISAFLRCFAAACGYLLFPGHGMSAERAVDLELVLAVDISNSMDLEEAALVRQGFGRAFRNQAVIGAIRRGLLGRIAVTYVEWGQHRYQRTRVNWTEISDPGSGAAFADAVEQSSVMLVDWTSISGAITFGVGSFEGNGFDGRRRVIDISGDGPNNNGESVNLARDRAVEDGVVINGLPIINNRPQIYGYPPFPDLDLYYRDCVIGGPGAFTIVANGFEDFGRAVLRKLVTEIAGRSAPKSTVVTYCRQDWPALQRGGDPTR